MLGPADGAAVHRLDVDQAGLAEPLEVEAHGVGVQAEAVGELLGRERRVDVASSRYIAYRVSSPRAFEHRQIHGSLDGSRPPGIFSRSDPVFIRVMPMTTPPTPTTPARPSTSPSRPAAHARRRAPACWPGSSTPSSTRASWSSGMVDDIRVEPDGARHREGRAHHRRVPAAPPDQDRRRVEGARPPRRDRRQGRVRRDDRRAEDRGDAARPLERPRERRRPPRSPRPPACSRSRAARAASASRRSP